MNTMRHTVRTGCGCLALAFLLGPGPGNAAAGNQSVRFSTADGVSIAATMSVPDTENDQLPAVIFIHQGGSSKEEWTSLPIFQQVTGHGMLALAYDVRGHGESDGEADFTTLFDDPNQSPRDMAAAIEWLRRTGRVDMSRIAVVGASIGGNLACVAAGTGQLPVKTAVAMSAKVSAVYNLAGGQQHLTNLHSLFVIAAELEQEGKRAKWASELYVQTAEPRQLEIVADSSSHGVSMFGDDPTLQQRILDWLLLTL